MSNNITSKKGFLPKKDGWKCAYCGETFTIRRELYAHKKESGHGKLLWEKSIKENAIRNKRLWEEGKLKGHKCSEEQKQKLSKIAIERSYWSHRSKEPIIYESKIAGKINLDSYWELYVAQRLDILNVKWYRPKIYLEYYTKDDKLRYYCPDFYVESYNCFIEVKSPYIAQRQNENGKIDYLKNNYNFIIWLESEEACKTVNLTKKDYNGDKPSILEENFTHKTRRNQSRSNQSRSKQGYNGKKNVDKIDRELYNKRKELIENSNIDNLQNNFQYLNYP